MEHIKLSELRRSSSYNALAPSASLQPSESGFPSQRCKSETVMVDLAPVLAGSKYSLRVPRAPVMFRSVSYEFPTLTETLASNKEAVPSSKSFNFLSVLPFFRSHIHGVIDGDIKGNKNVYSFSLLAWQ